MANNNDNDKAAKMADILKRQRERAKTGKTSTVGGQKELPKGTTPAGTPTGQATETGGPTRLESRAKKIYQERTQARQPGVGGAGRLQKVSPDIQNLEKKQELNRVVGERDKVRGEMRRTITGAKPKKDLTAGTIGGTKQKTPSQMGVSAKTGQPKKTWWQKTKAYATRHDRPGERAPRTQAERFGSIRRASQRTFPAEKGTKTDGILNIEELRRQTTGPMGATQRPARVVKRTRELSLAEKQRKGMRVTAADVPGTGKGPTPVGPTVKAGGAPGAAKVTTHRAATGTDLGAYTVKGYKPKKKKYVKPPGRKIPERAETFGEIWSGLFGKKKK